MSRGRRVAVLAFAALVAGARSQEPGPNYELFAAAKALDLVELERLLKTGISPNSHYSEKGGRIIMAIGGWVSPEQDPVRTRKLNAVVKMLIDYGGVPVEPGTDGYEDRHLLHSAAANLNLELLEFLLERYGPDPWVRQTNGVRSGTPLMSAVHNVIEMNGAAVHGPASPFWSRGVACVTLLCKKGSNPLNQNMYGTTIINYVCWMGYADWLRPMLADENERYGRANYQTAATGWAPYEYAPLHAACLKNTPENAECVRILLEAGADPTQKDRLGRTARDIAVQKKLGLVLSALGGR